MQQPDKRCFKREKERKGNVKLFHEKQNDDDARVAVRCGEMQLPNPAINFSTSPDDIGDDSVMIERTITYRRFLLGLRHPPDNAVLLYAITLFKSMLVSWATLIASGTTGSRSIDALYRVESLCGRHERTCGVSVSHCAAHY